MQGTKVASRYAKSLLGLSLELGILEKVYADMKLIQKACQESHELSLMLKSPIIKSDKKEKIIKELFGSKIYKVSLSFIEIIARKRRETYLELIAATFVEQYKKHKKILTAVVTTAVGLDNELREKVLNVVKESQKAEVELVEKVNQDLIGGFIIRVGDKQDDTSIRTKLLKLNRVFKENPYIKEF